MFAWDFKSKVAPRRNVEISGAFDGMSSFTGQGLIAGTQVATEAGWVPVESLRAGDAVLTFDNGSQVIADVRRTKLFVDPEDMPASMLPVLIPAGELGNKVMMRVLPEQSIMIETDIAEEQYGDPFALVPAASLVGFEGVQRDNLCGEIEVITISFVHPQVIYADGGLLVYCPAKFVGMPSAFLPSEQSYNVLPRAEADFLVDLMHDEVPIAAAA